MNDAEKTTSPSTYPPLPSHLRSTLILHHHPTHGRALLAKHNLPTAGTVVFTDTAFVSALSNDSVHTRCHSDGCWQLLSGTRKLCSVCRSCRYCSKQCQVQQWPLHKLECRALESYRQEAADQKATPANAMEQPTLIIVTRIALRRQHMLNAHSNVAGAASAVNEANPWSLSAFECSFARFDCLYSHLPRQSDDNKTAFAHLTAVTQRLIEVQLEENSTSSPTIAQTAASSIDNRDIYHWYATINCNTHSICDGSLRSIGIGLFPIACLLNHSCSPNCVMDYDAARPQLVRVRTIRPVQENEELTISYIDKATTRQIRQKMLQQGYCFVCDCALCIDTPENKEREIQMTGILCRQVGSQPSKQPCAGILDLQSSSPELIQCPQCGLTHDAVNLTHRLSRCRQLWDEAEELEKTNNREQETHAIWKYLQAKQCHQQTKKLTFRRTHTYTIRIPLTLAYFCDHDVLCRSVPKCYLNWSIPIISFYSGYCMDCINCNSNTLYMQIVILH